MSFLETIHNSRVVQFVDTHFPELTIASLVLSLSLFFLSLTSPGILLWFNPFSSLLASHPLLSIIASSTLLVELALLSITIVSTIIEMIFFSAPNLEPNPDHGMESPLHTENQPSLPLQNTYSHPMLQTTLTHQESSSPVSSQNKNEVIPNIHLDISTETENVDKTVTIYLTPRSQNDPKNTNSFIQSSRRPTVTSLSSSLPERVSDDLQKFYTPLNPHAEEKSLDNLSQTFGRESYEMVKR